MSAESRTVVDHDRPSTPTTGWLVELKGKSLDAPLFLSIMTADARFGWTERIDYALMLARQRDAEALARYADARTKTSVTATTRKIGADQASTDLERENARLRIRVSDLESILSALRRVRARDIEKAMEQSQDGVSDVTIR